MSYETLTAIILHITPILANFAAIMKVCVFCSANSSIDRSYFDKAAELGQWIGRNGHQLVYGGANLGLMECVARAAREAGATVIGVVPTILEKSGRASDCMDVCIPCDNLDDRKQLMVSQADAIVALPGGVGTLDEIFTVLAAAAIGYHHKRVVLYNIGGFWDSLLALMADMRGRGMLREGFDSTLVVASDIDEVAALCSL